MRLACSPAVADDVTAVVLDIGGVLLEWDPQLLYATLIPDAEEREWFLAEVCSLEWNGTLDAGRPFDDACAELAGRHPRHAELVHAWRRQDDMVGGARDLTAALVDRLAATGIPLYLLTNMPADVFAARRARFPFLRRFDGAVVSGEEGVVKPSPEIFGILLDRFHLDPARTLFVDDSQVNVSGARGAGIRAHHFVDAPTLEAELVALGLLT